MGKHFHIGEIVTVYSGKFLCPTGLIGIQALIEYITDQPHHMHQFGRAAGEIRSHLDEQFPWLADLQIPHITGEKDGRAYLAVLASTYGEYLEVEPLPVGAYVGREPVAEWNEKYPGRPFVLVELHEAGHLHPRGPEEQQ